MQCAMHRHVNPCSTNTSKPISRMAWRNPPPATTNISCCHYNRPHLFLLKTIQFPKQNKQEGIQCNRNELAAQSNCISNQHPSLRNVQDRAQRTLPHKKKPNHLRTLASNHLTAPPLNNVDVSHVHKLESNFPNVETHEDNKIKGSAPLRCYVPTMQMVPLNNVQSVVQVTGAKPARHRATLSLLGSSPSMVIQCWVGRRKPLWHGTSVHSVATSR